MLFLFEGLSNPKGGGELHEDYHQPTDDIEKIYADNNGNKPRRVKNLVVDILQQASNRK